MTTPHEEPTYRRLPIALIDPPTLAMRETMDEEKLDELTRDVRTRGIRSAIEVLQRGDRYEIISGHRRYCAAERVGLAALPCMVYTTRVDDLESDRYLENILREDVHPCEEAIYLAHLLEQKAGGDTDRLAAYVCKTRAYVENRLLLLQGDDAVFRALRADQIRVTVAQELNACPDEPARRHFLTDAVANGSTRAVVAGWVKDYQRWKEGKTALGVTPAPVDDGAPALVDAYFTCEVCRSTDNAAEMRPVNVHTYCNRAILQPLLRTYRGEDAPRS